jgi:hypothetical protein
MKVAARSQRSSNPPPISWFAHEADFSAAANPFRFIALHTPSDDGDSLLVSFQEVTHSFPSHGTGCSAPPNFHFQISNFTRLLSPVFATLTNFTSRKSIVCHSYENAHPIRMRVLSERQRVDGPLAKFNACHSYKMCAYKSIICHSYENTGGGTRLFPLWNSVPSTSFCDLSAVSCGPQNGHAYKPSSQRFWYA